MVNALVTGLGSATLRSLAPDRIAESAVDLRCCAERVREDGEQLVGGWRALPLVYEAPEVPALVAAVDPVGGATDALCESLLHVGRALEEYAEDMAILARRERAVIADVDDFSRAVAGDSEWDSDSRLVAQQDSLQHDADALACQLEDVIDKCVRTIESAEVPLVARTSASSSGSTSGWSTATVTAGSGEDPVAGDGRSWDLLYLVPPFSQQLEKMAPEQVNAWWTGLAPGAQAIFLASNPALIGGLDGVPASVRDTANRSRLDSELARLLTERDGLNYYERNVSQRGLSDEINEKIDGIAAITKALSAGDRQLLLFDVSGPDILAAVAVGDVDKARNVAILVGGTTTNVEDGLGSMDASAKDLRDRSAKVGKISPSDVAVVAWLGSQAPPNLWDAGFPSYSESAAPALVRFTQGVAASSDHSSDTLNLTVGGHSYAALPVTRAAQADGSEIDNVVTYGGPGISGTLPDGVDRYWMANANDPIRSVVVAGWYRYQPNTNDGWVELDTAGRMVDGVDLATGQNHDYLDDQTMPQHNLAAVVVDRPDQMVLY